MTKRTLSVFIELHDDCGFEVIVQDDETSMTQTFNQDTPDIETQIGVEVMSWLDMMTYRRIEQYAENSCKNER